LSLLKKSRFYIVFLLQILILHSCSTVPEKKESVPEKTMKKVEMEYEKSPPAPTLEDFIIIKDTVDGRPYQVSKLCGGLPVFIEVSASWCEACKEMYPTTEKLQKMFKGKVCFLRVMVDEKPFDGETHVRIVFPISSPEVIGLKVSAALPRVIVLNKDEKEPYADLTGKYPFLYYYGLLSEL